jgi:hypothetical protein
VTDKELETAEREFFVQLSSLLEAQLTKVQVENKVSMLALTTMAYPLAHALITLVGPNKAFTVLVDQVDHIAKKEKENATKMG